MRIPTQILAATSLTAVFLVAGSACVATSEETSRWQRWTTLQFKAKSALFRGNVEMRRTDRAGERSLETTTTARFLGMTLLKSHTRTTFEATTGKTQAYQSFSRKRGRRYSFGKEGYTVVKLRPSEDQDA